jgi:hypothetical protein
MAEKGAVMSDTNEAMQIVKGIDRNIDAMFPTLKSTFSKSTAKEKSVYLKRN